MTNSRTIYTRLQSLIAYGHQRTACLPEPLRIAWVVGDEEENHTYCIECVHERTASPVIPEHQPVEGVTTWRCYACKRWLNIVLTKEGIEYELSRFGSFFTVNDWQRFLFVAQSVEVQAPRLIERVVEVGGRAMVEELT